MSPPPGRSKRKPESWCRTVGSRKFAARLASVEEPADLADSALLPSHVDVLAFEQRHVVISLLKRLPPRERQVMAWTVDGYTIAEIAGQLGLSSSAVRTYLSQARRRLAEYREAL